MKPNDPMTIDQTVHPLRRIQSAVEPLLPTMLGSAIILATAEVLSAFGLWAIDSSTYIILHTVGHAFFYYFPIWIAYSLASAVGCSRLLAALTAAILLHPDLAALLAGGGASLFGVPIRSVVYHGTTLPIVLTIPLLWGAEKLTERILPRFIRYFLKPALLLLLILPVLLWTIGPLCDLIGSTLVHGIDLLYRRLPLTATALLSLLMPALLLCGWQNLSVSADPVLWNTAMLAAVSALSGTALGVLTLTRDRDRRQIASGALVCAVAGFPLPTVYGILLFSGKAFLITSLAALTGGAYAAYTHAVTAADSNPSSLLTWLGEILGGANRPLSFAVSFGLTALLGLLGMGLLRLLSRRDKPSVLSSAKEEVRPVPRGSEPQATPLTVSSPLTGEVIALAQMQDPAFSSGVLGQGCAIRPHLGKVYAPTDGTVSSVSKSGNCITFESTDGIALLIHVGTEDARLEEDCFSPCCRAGDTVQSGDLLLSFDLERLRREGIDPVTPLLIVNADRYEDLSLTCESKVKAGDRLLTLTPSSS